MPFGMGEEVTHQQVELFLSASSRCYPTRRVLGLVIKDHELVFRRAAGVNASLGDQRAASGQRGFTSGEGILVKRRLVLIPIERLQAFEAERFTANGRIPDTYFLHLPEILDVGLVP
jgi:hypothetical protein